MFYLHMYIFKEIYDEREMTGEGASGLVWKLFHSTCLSVKTKYFDHRFNDWLISLISISLALNCPKNMSILLLLRILMKN